MRYPCVIHKGQFSLYSSDYPRCQVKAADRHWLLFHEPSGMFVEVTNRREGLWLLKHATKRLH